VNKEEALALVHDRIELADMDPAARRLALRKILAEHEPENLGDLVRAVADSIDGYGPLTELLADPSVTDVLVNGPNEVYVERSGRLEPVPVFFEDAGELERLVVRLAATAGAHLDVSHPVADGVLPDGTRVHAVVSPVAPGGPLLSLRRHPRSRLSLEDLVAAGMLTKKDADRLQAHVTSRRSVVISGATGTGKTTLLNALLDLVRNERVVTIEETPELAPSCAHRVALVARPPNTEGVGEVTLMDLVRASLRMRPDRIIVGEVRGPEALAALAASATGHEGTLLTVHARSAEDALDRIAALALQAGGGMSAEALAGEARPLKTILELP
jgi:pilus assembly protein CpaF